MSPDRINKTKAACRPKIWAKYPTNGGPISMPTIPYVEIIDMAIPGEYFFELPAKENVIGNTAETPIPTKEKPINTGVK